MKHKSLSAGLLFAAALISAQAATPSNYAGIHGGVNDLGDWNADVALSPIVRLPGVASADRGRHWGVFGGRQTENARFELEYQWGDFDITNIRLGPLSQAVSAGGDYRALTANALRTHDFNEKFTGYAGLGLGWGEVKLPQLGFSAGCNCFAASKKSGFAWQARLGAEWHITPQHNAFLQYTWLRLPRPSGTATTSVDYERKSIGALSVGYRFVF
jgi:opacity protein-like surface antigen